MTTLADSECKSLLQSDRMDELDRHLNVIAGHAHLCSLGKSDNTCDISCSEIELRTIIIEERCMTATLVLSKNVNLSCKLLVRVYTAGLSDNLTSLDLISLNTTKKAADVITSISLVEGLTEHLDTGYNNLSLLMLNADDLYRIGELESTSLNTACSNSTTACDSEYVLNGHKERLILITNRCRDVRIYSIHELHDLVAPRAVRILKSLKSRTSDDRSIITGEIILVKELSDLHLNELKKLIIINHIALVHEYNDVRNTYLTGEKDMLSCLSHYTISSSNNEDSTVHLSCTCDHVLYIISMSRAVNMCIMSCLC